MHVPALLIRVLSAYMVGLQAFADAICRLHIPETCAEVMAKVNTIKAGQIGFPVQLKVKIMRQQAAREQKLRRKNLTKYIPNAAAAVFKVLKSMAQAPAVGSKRRRLQEEEDILEPVARGETVEATLAQRLTEYVERIDTDMVSMTVKEACLKLPPGLAPVQYIHAVFLRKCSLRFFL